MDMKTYCKCGSELNAAGYCIQQIKQHEFINKTIIEALKSQEKKCNETDV